MNMYTYRKFYDTLLFDSYGYDGSSSTPLSAEEIEKAAHEDYPHGSTHPIGSVGRSIYENKLASFIKGVNWLLSQRQPVAPEREEKDMDKAWMWWESLSVEERDRVWSGYKHNSYDEKILAIWRKETSPSSENKGGEG